MTAVANGWPAATYDEDGEPLPYDEDGEPLPYSESDIDRLVPLMAEHFAPRRFALCEVVRDDNGEPYDVQVIGWGLHIGADDDAVAFIGCPDDSGHAVRGEFQSADAAAQILRGNDDLRVAWVDPEPA